MDQTTFSTFAPTLPISTRQKTSPRWILLWQNIPEASRGRTLEIMPTMSSRLSCRYAMGSALIAHNALAPRMVSPMLSILGLADDQWSSVLLGRYTKLWGSLLPIHEWVILRSSFLVTLILSLLACTESGAYQVAPASGPSLISRVLQADYT